MSAFDPLRTFAFGCNKALMRAIAIVMFTLVAASCGDSNLDESSNREPVSAITSLAEVLAKNSDSYPKIVSSRQFSGNELRSDSRKEYYFEYGAVGRCFPRDNTQDIDENGAGSRKVDEITCFQNPAFDLGALGSSFGQLYISVPNYDESHRRLPANIPDGDEVYRFEAEQPEGVVITLTTTAPKSLTDALYEGGRLPLLNGPIKRTYAGKIKVREINLLARR